jgi:heme-degrading monooxygenase HmoA
MFGTVYRMRPKPGMEATIEDLMRREEKERTRPTGFIAGYLFRSRSRPGELIGVAVFDSEASYRKNANDPEQDRRYRRLRELLEADPEWNDGDVLTSLYEPSTVG